MGNIPLVSIVNATYNQAERVVKLLESLRNQSYKRLEIIIVSDGSTDNTKEIVEKFRKENPEYDLLFKFIEKEHSGVQHSRNAGLEIATGKYIIFPDSDCELYSSCIEKMVNVLETMSQISYVYCNMQNVGAYDSVLRCGQFDEQRLRKGNYIPVVTLMRREGCPRWAPEIKRHQDYDVWLSWLDNGGVGYWIDEVLFKHNTRKDSLTFTSVSIAEANRSVWGRHGLL